MSRRATGWFLLAWALGAATVTVALTRAAGEADGILVAVASAAVIAAVVLVCLDERRRRRRPEPSLSRPRR